MDVFKKKVLVLNRHWIPLRTCTLKRSIKLLFSDKAMAVDHETCSVYPIDEWKKLDPTDYHIKSGNSKLKLPEVIILKDCDKQPRKLLGFSKRFVLVRDQVCQYCGEYLTRSTATLDHVIPKSKGGKTTYFNTVAACRKCNEEKGSKTPEQAGMKLARVPFTPNFQLIFDTKINPNWDKFLGK